MVACQPVSTYQSNSRPHFVGFFGLLPTCFYLPKQLATTFGRLLHGNTQEETKIPNQISVKTTPKFHIRNSHQKLTSETHIRNSHQKLTSETHIRNSHQKLTSEIHIRNPHQKSTSEIHIRNPHQKSTSEIHIRNSYQKK